MNIIFIIYIESLVTFHFHENEVRARELCSDAGDFVVRKSQTGAGGSSRVQKIL